METLSLAGDVLLRRIGEILSNFQNPEGVAPEGFDEHEVRKRHARQLLGQFP